MDLTGPKNRERLTADEELRVTALEAAVKTVDRHGKGASSNAMSAVDDTAKKYYEFLKG